MLLSYIDCMRVTCVNPTASSIEFIRAMKNILRNIVEIIPESDLGRWKKENQAIHRI